MYYGDIDRSVSRLRQRALRRYFRRRIDNERFEEELIKYDRGKMDIMSARNKKHAYRICVDRPTNDVIFRVGGIFIDRLNEVYIFDQETFFCVFSKQCQTIRIVEDLSKKINVIHEGYGVKIIT